MKIYIVDPSEYFLKIIKIASPGIHPIHKFSHLEDAVLQAKREDRNSNYWLIINASTPGLNRVSDLSSIPHKDKTLILHSKYSKIPLEALKSSGFTNILPKSSGPEEVKNLFTKLHLSSKTNEQLTASILPKAGEQKWLSEENSFIQKEIQNAVKEYLDDNLTKLLKIQLQQELERLSKPDEDKANY